MGYAQHGKSRSRLNGEHVLEYASNCIDSFHGLEWIFETSLVSVHIAYLIEQGWA
jgi:hypothetical protein